MLDKFDEGPSRFNFKRWMKIEVWGAIAALFVPLALYFLPISDPDLHYNIGVVVCFVVAVLIVLFGGSLLKKK